MPTLNLGRWIVLGLFAILLVSVVACGASEAPATEPQAAPQAQAQPQAEPSAPSQSAAAAAPSGSSQPATSQSAPAPTSTPRPAGRSTLVPTPTPAPVVEPVVEQAAAGTLNIGYSQLGPPKFTPKLSGSPQTAINLSSVWESMWHSDSRGNVIPRLVKEWSVSDDGNVWTLHLEENVPFHKGKGNMTAQDIIWSMDNIISEGTVSGRLAQRRTIFYAEGGGMTAVDDHTLQVDTTANGPGST